MSALLEERKARVRSEWEKAFAALPGRPKKEWIGKTPTSRIPPDVKLRIVKTWKETCHCTGLKITTQTPDFDHLIALEDGGENRESNLRPALPTGHRVKTAIENSNRDRADRMAKKKLGLAAPKKPIESAPLPKAAPQRKASGKSESGRIEALRALGDSNLSRRIQNV